MITRLFYVIEGVLKQPGCNMVLTAAIYVSHGGVFFAGETLSVIVSLRNGPLSNNLHNKHLKPHGNSGSLSMEKPPASSLDIFKSSMILPSFRSFFNDNENTSFSNKPNDNLQKETKKNTFKTAVISNDHLEKPILINYSYIQVSGNMFYDDNTVRGQKLSLIKSKSMFVGAGLNNNLNSKSDFDKANYQTDLGTKTNIQKCPVFSTPPSILSCDEKFNSGDCREFQYSITLPKTLPPSYKGQFVNFKYNIAIGIQIGHFDDSVKIINIPFTVFGSPFSTKPYNVLDPILIQKDDAIVTDRGSHAYLESNQKLISFNKVSKSLSESSECLDDLNEVQDLSLIVRELCQTSRSSTFNIGEGDDHIAKLIIIKDTWRLGDTIIGILDFQNGKKICHHCSIFLEYTESINSEFDNVQGKPSISKQTIASEHRDVTCSIRSGICLPIPLGNTPTYETSVAKLEWSIRVKLILKNTLKNDAMHLLDFGSANLINDENYDTLSIKTFDSKSITNAAAFECVVPIRVLGARNQSSIPLTHLKLIDI